MYHERTRWKVTCGVLHKAEKVLWWQRTALCFNTLFHKVLPAACTRQLCVIRKHVLVAAQRRRSPPHPPAKAKCNLTCSRKPIKVKKVRANEWVNWLRLSTRACASERLRTHSPAPQPRQSQEAQRQLCRRLSSQKSFPNKRLFHLPAKHYHVWEGNTQQPFQIHNSLWQEKKNTAANFANDGNDPPSLNSSIYFQSMQTLAAAVWEWGEQGRPFLCHTGAWAMHPLPLKLCLAKSQTSRFCSELLNYSVCDAFSHFPNKVKKKKKRKILPIFFF